MGHRARAVQEAGEPMSKPRYRWWGYVKAVIRAYPALDKVMREPIYTPTTARYSTQPPQAGDGRSLECAVAKKLDGQDIKEYEAVSAAIRATERLPNGKARLKIIDLVYWQGTHTLAGAGLQVGYSYRHSQRVSEQFAYLVAENLNLKEKMASKSQKNVVK